MTGHIYSLKSKDRWRCLIRGALFVFLSAVTLMILLDSGFRVWTAFLFLIFALGTFLEISRFATWDTPRIVIHPDRLIIVNYWGFGHHIIPLGQILNIESSRRKRSNGIFFVHTEHKKSLFRGKRSFAVWSEDFEAAVSLREELISLIERDSRAADDGPDMSSAVQTPK